MDILNSASGFDSESNRLALDFADNFSTGKA